MTLKKTFLSLAFTALLSTAAFAATIDDYKAKGYIGETSMGMLGVVTSSAPADVKRFVKETNDERLERYKAVAQKNGISLEQTQKLAGQKLIRQSGNGEWVQKPSGEWVQK